MPIEKIRVLYIDDEVNNLQSFKALFRKDYDIFTAESGAEAKQILDIESIHVIISDQRMPGMTGVEFFESILEKHPHPIRILLTGYTDIQVVVEAINRGQVYRFIDKPWDPQALSVAIKNAYDIFHTRLLLREQNVQLKKAYDELDKFIYSASHDLRAPLASVLGLVKVSQSDDINKMPDYMHMIETTVHKMDVFVQNVIKYHRSNRLDVEISHIQFEKLINEILEDLHNNKIAENFIIEKNITEPVYIRSDESRIRIILSNIILNSLKFFDEAKTVRKLNIKIDSSSEKTFIVIEDNGVGVSDEFHEKIFEMFFRGNHKNAGSGVGLYVANEAAKKINGSIKIKSTPSVGSRFTIELPNLI
jgi:signal transduction histidine kinase